MLVSIFIPSYLLCIVYKQYWLFKLKPSVQRLALRRTPSGLLGGSGVVISRVISPLIWVISIVTLLITLLITTPEPPSTGSSRWSRKFLARNVGRCAVTLTYQNPQKSRVPINSILGFIIRAYKKVGFGRLRYSLGRSQV